MKILNLYAGLGGNRELWDDHIITAVEHEPKIAYTYSNKFPHDFIRICDVHVYLRDISNNLNYFDFIWASPPCQSHSQMMRFYKNTNQHPPIPRMDEIFGLLTWLPKYYDGLFCIENVQSWYKWIIKPTVKIDRHCFWANFPIPKRRFRDLIHGHGSLNNSRIMRDTTLNQHQRNMVDPRIGKYILDCLPLLHDD